MNNIIILSRKSMTLNLFFKDFAQYLLDKNINVKLCCNDTNNIKISHSSSVTFKLFNSKNYIFFLKYLFLIIDLYFIGKKYKDHIFIINTPLISHLFRLSTFFLDLKIIYFVHGYRFHNKGNFFLNLFFKFLEIVFSYNTKAYININDYDYNFTKYKIKKKSIKINGVGIDISKKIFKKNKKKKRLNIGIIGAYKKNKGYGDLIKICKDKRINNKANFICYGYGNTSKYLKVINKNKLKNIFINNFTDNIYNAIDNFDLLLHLSYREGLPVSVMQALIRGKPVICYNVRGCIDLIKNNINGYVVSLSNTDKVIDVINNLSKNDDILEKLSLNAYNSINEEYSTKNISQKIYKYINEV